MVHLLQCSSAPMPLLGPIFFSILLLTSSMEVAYSDATGRLPLRLQEEIASSKEEERGEEMEGRGLIGSRPPRCERVCISCAHCRAVQVPVVPQLDINPRLHHNHNHRAATAQQQEDSTSISAAMFSYRVNGITNYKPLSWKCRCGGAILDP
ncbi:hypothetical protein ACP4OV_011962 [Aristida adscensionis]